jgi:hypothetical protein
LCVQQWPFWFHEMFRTFWTGEDLLTLQEGLGYVELFT